jgi:hypothetical protein
MAIEPGRLHGGVIPPKTAPRSDFNCGKTEEPQASCDNMNSSALGGKRDGY